MFKRGVHSNQRRQYVQQRSVQEQQEALCTGEKRAGTRGGSKFRRGVDRNQRRQYVQQRSMHGQQERVCTVQEKSAKVMRRYGRCRREVCRNSRRQYVQDQHVISVFWY